MRFSFSFLLLILISFSSIGKVKKSQNFLLHYTPFDSTTHPIAPDYSNPNSWAALPFRADVCDYSPAGLPINFNDTALADVFFIHPTSYTAERINGLWNADINDKTINDKTDKGTMKFQASVFNHAGRIYAPRYRQAHLSVYYNGDTKSCQQALDLAYEDVKAAFEYYLKHYNHGRPIIIASHSQGSTHGIRLLKEFFDGTPLQKQLVAAYLVGMAVDKNKYTQLKPCNSADETGCICSWRSFEYGFTPSNYPMSEAIICINPLTWKADTIAASRELNKGSVLRNYNKTYFSLADAQVHNSILWVHKPKFFGSALLHFKNYHIADYNFFYVNTMENVHQRLMNYLKENKK